MIYLDSNATSQIHPEVVDAMLPYLRDHWHNPSSGYAAGKLVKQALRQAREQVAALINAQPDELVFTGCGTESNNAALASLIDMAGKKKRLVTSTIEHSAILRPAEYYAQLGYDVEKVAVGHDGRLDLLAYEESLRAGNVALSSIMWANNETGVIQPMDEVSALTRELGVPLHTDAIQAVGKMPVDVQKTPVDMLSLSGHKFHAPKGVGALYIRRGVRFQPMLRGGGQEAGHRSGTENVASIVGLGKAAEIMKSRLDNDQHAGVRQLRDHFESRLLAELTGVRVNGSLEHRAVSTSHLSFEKCDASGLLILLEGYGVLCSAGSACMTGKTKPSHVQTAMGLSSAQSKSSLRISFSIFTEREQVDAAVEAVKKAVNKLRSVQGGSGVGPVIVYT